MSIINHRPSYRFLGLVIGMWAAGCGETSPGQLLDAGVSTPDAGACSLGSFACGCFDDGTCQENLRCAQDRCETCPVGEEGCGCLIDDTCNAGLMCMNDQCVPDTCEVGEIGCPCDDRTTPASCTDTAYCAATDRCEQCTSDIVGCRCDLGTCGNSLVCGDDDHCREPRTCDDLRAEGVCGENQLCEPSLDQDALCFEDCNAGYVWDPGLRECLPLATCTPGAPGSIAATCQNELRTCIINPEGDDACGDCLQGAELVDGQCASLIDCGGVSCNSNEYCETSGVNGPTCRPRPCADPNQVQDSQGSCVTCLRSCNVEGSTGRLWPFQDAQGKCVCETRPGYYFPQGGDLDPKICDADQDGWVVDEIRNPQYDANHPQVDVALAENMRCNIRTIDQVRLQDEYGIQTTVHSCLEGLILNPQTADACSAPVPLRLLETSRNDTPGPINNADERAPAYGLTGRALRGEEVNGLSKACVDDKADFNDNQAEDFKEIQPTPQDTSLLNERGRLRAFTYFMELYTAQYVEDMGAPYGHLVISEKRRCDSETFPFSYADEGTYDPATADPYWRSCYRKRDAQFDMTEDRAGFDFAQWTCDSPDGTCPTIAPAHTSTNAESWDVNDPLLRNHGLCELNAPTPADQVWRGMHHHSQFKCVAVGNGAAADERDQREPNDFGGRLVMNACEAITCDGTDPTCLEARTTTVGETLDPVIRCTARADTPQLGEVGWAAVTYQPYGDRDGSPDTPPAGEYEASCVNEDHEWPYLCPYPEFGPRPGSAEDADGRYRCYGWESSFLWADPNETPAQFDRSSLIWAAPGQPALNGSVWGPRDR